MYFFLVSAMFDNVSGDGAGEAFMKKYIAQPRIPEHARYGKAREMVEKKVQQLRLNLFISSFGFG